MHPDIVVVSPLTADSAASPSSLLANPMRSPLLVHDRLERLVYDIEAHSSHSAQYHPRHILVNKPADQSSRWSSGSNNQLQFVTIRLERPSIVHTITFGKYHKVHVCNLKEFKVFGGMTADGPMQELLHSGLRNDSEPETFALKFKSNQQVILPVHYIKIVPLMAWGANFNFSIWYVELRGISEPAVVQPALDGCSSFRESEAIRLCLKHLRRRNLMSAFHELQSSTQLLLEHPSLTALHKNLVVDGNFMAAEAVLQRASEEQLFQEYITEAPYRPEWKRINATDANGESPCMRGGHQMCIDVESKVIYLFGGWNGTKDLADLWAYHIHHGRWECISDDTRRQSGPGPRSCHKICFDAKTRRIFVLGYGTMGRYIDPQARPTTMFESDLFEFDVDARKWRKICDSTLDCGGPELIYDHQMVVDSDRQVLYVFGGRIISASPNPSPDNSYSGLFAYDIARDAWKVIRTDPSPTDGLGVTLRSRIGHSMLFNHETRQLYIFAGQRHKDYLSDFYVYDIDEDRVTEMSRDYSKNGGAEPGFTQRATIDVAQEEFYMFSGLMREKNSTNETVNNSFWVYNIRRDRWSRVYQNENTGEEYWSKMGELEPCPRFAHQLVYDHQSKIQYLFGGNPGEPANQTARLDDFWSLKITKPKPEEILRRSRYLIRQQQFKEQCMSGDAMEALRFLQQELGTCVNHQNPTESVEFRNLTTYLFEKKAPPANPQEAVYGMRSALYEQLLQFFPESMKQPKENLSDLIPM